MAIFLFSDNTILLFIANSLAVLLLSVIALGTLLFGITFLMCLPYLSNYQVVTEGPQWVEKLESFSLARVSFWAGAIVKTAFWFVVYLQHELLGTVGILCQLTFLMSGHALYKEWISIIKRANDSNSDMYYNA